MCHWRSTCSAGVAANEPSADDTDNASNLEEETMTVIGTTTVKRGAGGVVALLLVALFAFAAPTAQARNSPAHRIRVLEAKVASLARQNRQQAAELRTQAGRIAALESDVACLSELSYLSLKLTWDGLNATMGADVFPVLAVISPVCSGESGQGGSPECGHEPSEDVQARRSGSDGCGRAARAARQGLREAVLR